MEPVNSSFGEYTITSDKTILQPEIIHHWLATKSYWCKGIPYEVFKLAFENSYTIGALCNQKQVAFARLVTDYATFAYLADVYVEDEHRGKGISKHIMDVLSQLDWVIKLRRLVLVTLDAHDLYKQYGFTALPFPERYMEIGRPDIYHAAANGSNGD